MKKGANSLIDTTTGIFGPKIDDITFSEFSN
jgi:hypothetical protein